MTENKHPKDWTLGERINYLHYTMKFRIDVISKMSDEQMIETILKSEIESE